MTIVMGLDQHRAQITAEWLDTATGEIARKRIAPADRDGVRGFAAAFGGQELEVALEATTGWRFVAPASGCATRSSTSGASGSSASRPRFITTASRRAAGCSAPRRAPG